MKSATARPLATSTLGKARQRGVTLVELMISVVIGLIIVAAASTVYLYSKQAFNSATETSQVEENGKFALNLLASSIQSAGFVMLDPAYPSRILGPADKKMSGCDHGFANSTAPTNATLATDLGCLAATPAGALRSESLSVFTETDPPSTDSSNVPFRGFNCVGTDATLNAAGIPQTQSHFFVARSTVQTPAGPVSAGQLACIADTTAAGVASFQRQPLIPGIEQIRFIYLEPNPNPAFDPNTPQVSKSATTLAAGTDGWNKVLAVEVCVLSKSNQPAGNDTGTAYTDCYGNAITASAGEVYRTFRTTVRLRNKSVI